MPEQDISKDVTKDSQQLLTLRLTRDAAGIQVALSSAIDWQKHFKASPPNKFYHGIVADGEERNPNCCRVRPGVQFSTVTASFVASARLFDNNVANVSCLLCDGIKEGVTLRFPAEAVSVEALKNWAKTLRGAVVELYSGYLKKADITVRIDCRQVGHTEAISME